ncbi:S41 family peptidase [Cryptosporangium aurantiacum]|uniref:N-terminal domain of Peptidase_S41 n=1 Tax=Cryptosporangium aurantiacum TaxID=134849 RepID=A0A1M7HIN7_9ACTN|nr:S41 family peptidase [Cryptosporangium aurantiacum]SHM28355.1 N-terminal domain of Peptidase_S41 [Cryptosporangium aurantiacum]
MRSAEIDAIVDRTIELLDQYVFPDVGARAGAAVRSAQAAGRYAEGIEPEVLGKLVTDDLQSINGDKHLRLQFTPDALPLTTGDKAADDDAEHAEAAREAARDAGGVRRVERLDGNLAYIEIETLWPPVIAAPAMSAAMTLADGADGLVIDLRRCRGGSPDMVAFVCSHLFGPDPVHLNDIYDRATDETRQYWTSSSVPGPRFGPERPVAVLTSAFTFSGGEELAWDLQELGRATLFGEITRGGAHPVDRVQVHPHLRVTVPSARSVSPRSGGNWEGTGVRPDVEVPAADALARAVEHLLGARES